MFPRLIGSLLVAVPSVVAVLPVTVSHLGHDIAFSRTTPGVYEDIYATAAGGANTPAQQLTTTPAASDVTPDVSPDGTRIVFARGSGLHTMNTGGAGVTAIPNTMGAAAPAWSPDGTRIAFDKGSGTASELYVIDVDGTGLTRLTFNSFNDTGPTWSPDGGSLAFTRWTQNGGASTVMVLDLHSGTIAPVAGTTNQDSHPDWSAHNRLVFSRYVGQGNADLYTIDPDGTNIQQLTSGPLYDGMPDWSRNGKKVAFSRGTNDEAYDKHIFVINANGKGLDQRTFGPVMDFGPSW